MKQIATKDDVEKVAIELMTKDGSTTTLDVKTKLRANGLWVKQSDVSQMMSELHDEKGWEFDENGIHRTYRIPDGGTSDPQTARWWGGTCGGTPNAPLPKSAMTPIPKPKPAPCNAQPLKSPVDGCWQAYVGTGRFLSNVVRYYPDTVSRDAARYALAKLLNLKNKDETRAKRWFS